MIPLPDFKRMSQYAVRLLNNACDTETQAEFDALALVPIDNGHPDKWLWSNMWQKQCLYRWNSDLGDYHIAH